MDRYGYTTTLPLEVFTQRNFVADYSIEIEFYSEQKQTIAFWATL